MRVTNFVNKVALAHFWQPQTSRLPVILSKGEGLVGGGGVVSVTETPSPETPCGPVQIRAATAAGGTHPTRMHSGD